jgi:hypothetical protein
MQATLEQQIVRARELLQTAFHAAMATVNKDGSPHNSPFMFMRDEKLSKVYWGSHPASIHSKNILRTGKLFVVLYNAKERGGLYLRCGDGRILEGEELRIALDIHNNVRTSRGKDKIGIDYYVGDSPQRMWSATIEQLWVNGTTRDQNDHVIQDIRTEITAADLLQ